MYTQSSSNFVCPPNTVAWAEKALGKKIVQIDNLPGSTSAAVLNLVAEDDTAYVLRLFTLKEWLENEPDLAKHEAAVLERAGQSKLVTPDLIAYDPTGQHTTHPAVLMTKINGKVELMPSDFDLWLRQLAETLHQIHLIEPDDFGWQYKHWFLLDDLQVPNWSKAPQSFARLIEFLQEPPPQMPSRFLHRDYHPTNLLWCDEKVSGVVDWVNGCVGPSMVDVAHCRLNLVSLYGLNAADTFLDYWVNLAGVQSYSLWWDIAGLANGDVFGSDLGVYSGWRAFGKDDLTVEMLGNRLDDFAKSLHRKIDRKIS